MKVFLISVFVGCTVLMAPLPITAADESGDEPSSPAPTVTIPSPAAAITVPATPPQEVPKPVQVTWPQTTSISEETKDIVATDSAKINVPLFEKAQQLCTAMDKALLSLDEQRNTLANKFITAADKLDSLIKSVNK